MVSSKSIWSAAIVLSLMAHAGAAAILTLSPEPEPEVAQTAGGVVEVAMLGNDAFETIESGLPEEIEPADELQPETLEPVPQEIAAIMPEEAVAEQVMPVETAEVPLADAIVPETSEAIEIPEAEVEIAAIPVPDIKPKLTEKSPAVARPLQDEATKQQERKVERKKRKKAGEKGESLQTTSRGHADGAAEVKTASLGGQKIGNASAAGNAAVDNYPGKVRNKINRAKRRVAGTGGGTVTVSFTISASGQASGIRILASSGQPELDQAAMDAVRRAAPFPDIPDAAGRSSWSFSVPIAFKR